MPSNNKDKILVIGGGGHAKAIISNIKKLNTYEIIGYTDCKNNGLVLGVKYLGTDEVLTEIKKNFPDCKAVVGIGTITLSDKQQRIYSKLKELGFELPVIISKNAEVMDEVIIGEGTVVFEGAVISVNSKIGKCVIINTRAIVEYNCSIGDFVHIAPLTKIGKRAKVGNNTFIGSGTMVRQHTHIADNCLIGAGSVILENTVPGTYMGIPAVLKKSKLV